MNKKNDFEKIKMKDIDKSNIIHAKFDQIIKFYSFEEKMGKGGYGDVYKATQIETGQKVAIKHIQFKEKIKDLNKLSKFLHLLKLLKLFNSN